VNEVKVTVRSEGKGLDVIESNAKRSGAKVGQYLEQGFREGEQAGSKAAKSIEKDLLGVADAGRDAGKSTGDSLTSGIMGSLGDGLGKMKGAAALLSGGGLIATTVMDGVQGVMQEQSIGKMIAFQTGSSTEAAGKLGDVAGDAFSDGFGDSVEEVGEAVQAVLNSKLVDVNASQEDIDKMTKFAIAASKKVGAETKEIGNAAEQLLRTGLAGNAEEAMNIIVQASDKGINKSEDLLDTIGEYSTKFRDLGLSGPEAMGLLGQALEGGARDTDVAADALKEFVNIATEGGAEAGRGFAALGLDAGKMSADIAAGGSRAHDALGKVLGGLNNIHDPLKRDQIATDLFGDKAEDLGDALFNMDLDKAAAQFGDYSGKAKKAADELKDTITPLEKLGRGILAGINNTLEGIGNLFSGPNLDDMKKKVKEYQDAAAGKDGTGFDLFSRKIRDTAGAIGKANDKLNEGVQSFDDYLKAATNAADGIFGLWDAENRHAAAIDDATASLLENGKTLDKNTDAGRANRDALAEVAETTLDQVEAMKTQGATMEEIQGVIATQREEFIQLAIKMGMSRDAAILLADRLKLIPGTYTATVVANTGPAVQTVSQFSSWLNGVLAPRSVSVSARYQPGIGIFPSTGGYAHGGIVGAEQPVLHRQSGGPGHSMIVQNEQGWELTRHPDGSTVVPAGASQMMMNNLAENSGGGGPVQVQLVPTTGANADRAGAAWINELIRGGLVKPVVVGKR
jgi:hypothetical protein